MKVDIDPEEIKRQVEATRLAYVANKDRKDRIFGETYQDVRWEQDKWLRQVSSGWAFRYVAYNGGYPSYFTLVRAGQRLHGDVKMLYVNAHPLEPIYVAGPAVVASPQSARTTRNWTDDERHLIASFFQTLEVQQRIRDQALKRAQGFHEKADVLDKIPVQRPSVVFDS